MSSGYSSPPSASPPASTVSQPVKITAGTAVKIGFFGALGATLFSLILSAILGIAFFVLILLGVAVNIPNMPR